MKTRRSIPFFLCYCYCAVILALTDNNSNRSVYRIILNEDETPPTRRQVVITTSSLVTLTWNVQDIYHWYSTDDDNMDHQLWFRISVVPEDDDDDDDSQRQPQSSQGDEHLVRIDSCGDGYKTDGDEDCQYDLTWNDDTTATKKSLYVDLVQTAVSTTTKHLLRMSVKNVEFVDHLNLVPSSPFVQEWINQHNNEDDNNKNVRVEREMPNKI